MVNKIIGVLIELLFPLTHLQRYMRSCSQIQFESKLTPRIQTRESMFYPFYYKDPFVRDCIFELKERNSKDVARLFGKILSRWIVKKCIENKINIQHTPIYLVPIPQHISKTKEKGFCHTTTLACSIEKIITTLFPDMSISTFPCISKIKKTKRLHDSSGKQKRFVLIKNTMQTHITSQDAKHACFFIIDDVFTTGATFKEARRSLLDCAALPENIFFVSIAH